MQCVGERKGEDVRNLIGLVLIEGFVEKNAKPFKISFPIIIAISLIFSSYPARAVTLQVPAYGTPTVTSPILEVDQLYRIEVRGIFGYDSGSSIADAEWALPDTYAGWVEFYDTVHFEDTLDLLINESAIDWWGTNDGVIFSPHVFSPSHIYRYEIEGIGTPINLRIEDGSGSRIYDNTGFLEVEIMAISTPVPEPSTCLLFLFGMIGMAGIRRKN